MTIRALKVLVFLASLGPAAWLVWAALTGNLSANPLSDLTNETGVWALRFTWAGGMVRLSGGGRWNRLHKLVYAPGVLGVVHYWWLVKADVRRPIIYGMVVGTLLALRFYWATQRAAARAPAPRRVPAP